MRPVRWAVQSFIDLWVTITHRSAYQSTPYGPVLTCLECDERWPCSAVTDVVARRR